MSNFMNSFINFYLELNAFFQFILIFSTVIFLYIFIGYLYLVFIFIPERVSRNKQIFISDFVVWPITILENFNDLFSYYVAVPLIRLEYIRRNKIEEYREKYCKH